MPDSNSPFSLPAPADRYQRRQVFAWLGLALGAMAVSTLFAVLLVLARTPGIQDLMPGPGFFRAALVAHVDFSVLIWLLSCAGLIWSLGSSGRRPLWDGLAVALAVGGAFLMAIVSLGVNAPVVMSNYVPVLEHPGFLTGLGLFAAGATLQALRLLSRPRSGDAGKALRPGMVGAALAMVTAVGVLVWSYYALPTDQPPRAYYEGLFWGAGHVLQFSHSLLLLVGALALLNASGRRLRLQPRSAAALFVVGTMPVAAVPLLLLTMDGTAGTYRHAFTLLMEYGTPLTLLPLGGALLWSLQGSAGERRGHPILYLALLLLAVGLGLGLLIRSDNLMVTAHYHGTNAAVTLVFMGFIYQLLPRLGYADPINWKLTRLQPFAYAGGMALYIAGMAWSGFLDLPRKTAGAAQGLHTWADQAAMALMGLGGVVAVVASALFVILCLRALRTVDEPEGALSANQRTHL